MRRFTLLRWVAVLTLFIVVGIEGAINFLVPLYIQIIQGRSSAATSVAMMPFMLTVFFTATLIVRLYDRLTPRRIARIAFVLVTVGALWLAFVASNDWSVFPRCTRPRKSFRPPTCSPQVK